MKKSELMIAIGQKPSDVDEEMDADEGEMDDDSAVESEEDEAIDLAMDPEASQEERREAFKRAVELCMKRGY